MDVEMHADNSRHASNELAQAVVTNEFDNLSIDDEGAAKFIRPTRTGYLYDERMMLHTEWKIHPDDLDDDDEGHHPEQPNRIKRIHERLLGAGCLDLMTPLKAKPLQHHQALLVHTQDHWEKVAAIAYMSEDAIENSRTYYEHLSLYIHTKTPEAALLSAGGVIEASLAVARGEVRNAFANVRPPGHHAEPDEHMGFCFFNNVAVAAKVIQLETPLKKIMILDWDVHHGNGTQRAFYDDDTVLYISLHRYEEGTFYPSGPFGSMESCGEGKGLGYSVNVPWPEKGTTDADYIYAFMKIVMPIAYEFAPELVIISAGFDAADGDMLGECFVSPAGYAHMTHMLSSLAGGKLVVALEGGYNLESISRSALAVAEVILGNPPPMMPEQYASDIVTETIWFVAQVQSNYWQCIDPKACEPKEAYIDQTFSIPDILKAHRADYMSTALDAYSIPIADDRLQEAFTGQILCSEGLYTKEVLVAFIHDYGSLRGELIGASHMDLNLEKSYLLDASKTLCEWVKSEHFGLLDVNIYPRSVKLMGEEIDLMKRILIYMWDNYIELSDAPSVVLVASGTACGAVTQLMKERDIRDKVKAVVQVIGTVDPPRLTYEDELRSWYKLHSLVLVPENHPGLSNKHFHRAHGTVRSSGEAKVSLMLSKSIPFIIDFVRNKLGLSPADLQNNLGSSNGAS